MNFSVELHLDEQILQLCLAVLGRTHSGLRYRQLVVVTFIYSDYPLIHVFSASPRQCMGSLLFLIEDMKRRPELPTMHALVGELIFGKSIAFSLKDHLF